MNLPFLAPELSNKNPVNYSSIESYKQAESMLYGNGKDIQVFVGLLKKDRLYVRWAAYKEPVREFDDVLSTIILRGRHLTKELGSKHDLMSDCVKAAEAMSLEGVYLIDMFNSMECPVRNMNKNLPPNVVVFFLDEKTQWKMFSTCPDYTIAEPTLVKNVYKDYYTEFYPKEVVDFAFADPKNIMRVFDYKETNNLEDFSMEPLFLASDIVEHVLVPLEQALSA